MLQIMGMDYLSSGQIQNELNLRGYFSATTPPVSPPVTYTNTQVLGWCVDAGLQNIGKPFTPSQSTDLTASQWSEVIRIATAAAPQLNTQYGTDLAITQDLIEWNLHLRNYWLGSAPVTPPVTKPTATLAQILKASVDFALQYYNYPISSSTKVTVSSGGWSNIVNVAMNKDKELEAQYTVLSGMSGLSGLGIVAPNIPVCDISSPYYNDAACDDAIASGSSDNGWIGWEILLSMLSIGASTWSDAMRRKRQLSEGGYTFNTPTTSTDYNARIQQLMTQYGWSRDQADQYINSYNKPTSQLPSWALPAIIGAGAYLLLRGRS